MIFFPFPEVSHFSARRGSSGAANCGIPTPSEPFWNLYEVRNSYMKIGSSQLSSDAPNSGSRETGVAETATMSWSPAAAAAAAGTESDCCPAVARLLAVSQPPSAAMSRKAWRRVSARSYGLSAIVGPSLTPICSCLQGLRDVPPSSDSQGWKGLLLPGLLSTQLVSPNTCHPVRLPHLDLLGRRRATRGDGGRAARV